jgi:hypothetical protein
MSPTMNLPVPPDASTTGSSRMTAPYSQLLGWSITCHSTWYTGLHAHQVRNFTDATVFSDGRFPVLRKIFHNPRVQKMRKRRFLHLSEDNERRVVFDAQTARRHHCKGVSALATECKTKVATQPWTPSRISTGLPCLHTHVASATTRRKNGCVQPTPNVHTLILCKHHRHHKHGQTYNTMPKWILNYKSRKNTKDRQCAYKRNNGALSPDHCSRGYCVCV